MNHWVILAGSLCVIGIIASVSVYFIFRNKKAPMKSTPEPIKEEPKDPDPQYVRVCEKLSEENLEDRSVATGILRSLQHSPYDWYDVTKSGDSDVCLSYCTLVRTVKHRENETSVAYKYCSNPYGTAKKIDISCGPTVLNGATFAMFETAIDIIRKREFDKSPEGQKIIKQRTHFKSLLP